MPNLELPGATLFYETHGSGPCLLLIAAGASCCDAPLSHHFKVITYDSRGHSKSFLTGAQDYSQRLPAYIFGYSSGAVVAYMVALRHAVKIMKLVLHKPPLYRALPQAQYDELYAMQENMCKLYRDQGVHPALVEFSKGAISPKELTQLRSKTNPTADPYALGNILYWFELEFMSYPFVEIDWAGLEKVKDKLLLAESVDNSKLPPAEVSRQIAKRLGMGTVTTSTRWLPDASGGVCLYTSKGIGMSYYT